MNFFNESYGIDLFSLFLILVSSILNLFSITRLLAGVILFYALYRVFSRNVEKREQEHRKFCMYANRFLSNFKRWFNEKKNYKIVKCPKCGQKLRLPRGKG